MHRTTDGARLQICRLIAAKHHYERNNSQE
jgi:hypothetical protein